MLFVLVLNVAIYLLVLHFPPSFFFFGVLIALIIIPSELTPLALCIFGFCFTFVL